MKFWFPNTNKLSKNAEIKILRKNVYDLQLELKNAYKKLDSLRECAIELYSKASSGVKDDRTTK